MRYVLYARGHREPDLHPRIYVPIFDDPGIARAWLDYFLSDDEPTRLGDLLTLSTGIKLKSEQLDTILKASPQDLPDIHVRRILRFKYGTWDEVHAKAIVASKSALQVERPVRAQCPPGYVTISDLCSASGTPASHARAMLRAIMNKPAYGWAFAPNELPRIKEICGIA